jgi:hypothetical protein
LRLRGSRAGGGKTGNKHQQQGGSAAQIISHDRHFSRNACRRLNSENAFGKA